MAIEIGGIHLPLSAQDADIKAAAAEKLGILPSAIQKLRVRRQSLDARRTDVQFVYTLHVTLYDEAFQRGLEIKHGAAQEYRAPDIAYGTADCGRPVVVGAGPCGLFAALTLAQHGYRPLLIDRGSDMDAREKDVENLAAHGTLDAQSNVCFGAGGAGAFSDGKLTTRIKDIRAEHVLDVLADCGAPGEIRYMAKPHMGTEHVRRAVSEMIHRIRALGGTVCFRSRLDRIDIRGEALTRVTYVSGDAVHHVDTHATILAIGHSARDTYEMLLDNGVAMTPKPFAIGLRIEHPRRMIDTAQYGSFAGHPRLGAAEYRLSAKHGQRGVYTFCMCPGGEVICAATEPGGVAVNGMSYYPRDGENSNSAVVVSVAPDDFDAGVLGGVAFQRRFERAAYACAGGFGAPVQRAADFLAGRVSKGFGAVKPTYRPYTVMADLTDCLPPFVSAALKHGITRFGHNLAGFNMPDAVLTGVETRTSAPVRVMRQSDGQSVTVCGLFPAGEGAGYAGGIVSAAVDGIKSAEALMRVFAPPK
jgi:uncharacterized FAD-dependent dehydrogenase